MRVLVTGGAGHIARVRTAALPAEGPDGTGLDDPSTGHGDAVAEGARFVRASLHDSGPVPAEVAPEAVQVFAARSLVGQSRVEPEGCGPHNVGGTLDLLGAMGAADCRRIVFSSAA